MFGQSIIAAVGVLLSNIARLLDLQAKSYAVDIKRSKSGLMGALALILLAGFFLFTGVLLTMSAVVWALFQNGMSLPAALLSVAGGSLVGCVLLLLAAYGLAKSRMNRFAASNEELKINLACIREQLTNSTRFATSSTS